jgi:hypothetical protein
METLSSDVCSNSLILSNASSKADEEEEEEEEEEEAQAQALARLDRTKLGSATPSFPGACSKGHRLRRRTLANVLLRWRHPRST